MMNTDGFGSETFDYLRDLAANNDKVWFEANRERYEAQWLTPAQDFVQTVSEAMSDLTPPHQAVPKVNQSIRRIHRDVRFSKDKTPYQPALHLVFWAGDHPNRAPAIHLVLHEDKVGYGVGQWALTPEALTAWRDAVLDDAAHAQFLSALKLAESTGCELAPPELKKLPKELPQDTGRDDLLKRKSVVVRTIAHEQPPETILGRQGIDWFIDVAARLAPIDRWLVEHLG